MAASQTEPRERDSDGLLDLVRRAHRTRRRRARLIVEFCLEQLPHYRNLPDSMLAEVTESVVHHLAILYRVTLETGHPLSSEDLAKSRRLARLRAAQGVPLGEFLAFFQVGLSVAWTHLMTGIGEDPILRSRLLERVSAVISNQTQLTTALTESYVAERDRLSRFREQDRAEFFRLLSSEDAAEHVLEARARSLGIPLDEPRSIAVFGPASSGRSDGASFGGEDLQLELTQRLPQAAIWIGRSRDGFIALLPPDPEPQVLAAAIAKRLGEDDRVGVGSSGRGIAGLRQSAREALRALRIGRMLGGTERVHRYAELAVLDLVGIGSPEAREFMRGVLGPLSEPGANETTLETLRQLAANNHRIKVTAAALSIHPHTLSYRVKQIRRSFGLDLEDPEVRLRVHLALLIRDARS